MKRVIQRKAEQNIYGALSKVDDASKKQKRASQDIGNKTRTSAAMLGLALSMGASGSLLSCYKGAIAAEPNPVGISSMESGVGLGEHIIREGETLWTLAERYHLSSASLAELNGFEPDVVLRVGQVIRVPYQLTGSQATHKLTPESVLETEQEVDESTGTDAVDSPTVENLAHLQVQSLSDSSAGPAEQEIASTLKHASTKTMRSKEAGVTALPPSLKPSEDIVEDSDAVNSIEAGSPGADLPETEALEIALTDPVNTGVVDEEEAILASTSPNYLEADESASEPSNTDAIAFSDVSSDVVEKPSAALRDIPPVERVSSETHQIQVGETLAMIARSYGISTQQLIEANRIYDPNRIFAGQVLTLPAEATVAVVPESVGSDYYVIPGAPNEIDIQEAQVDSTEAQPVIPQSQPVDDDFYVRQLLDEIEEMADAYDSGHSLQGTVLVESASEAVPSPDALSADAPSTDIAYAPAPSTSASLLEQASDSRLLPTDAPEETVVIEDATTPGVSAPTSAEPRVVQEQDIQDSPQLVASAPLGSENYVPLNQPVTGRMVSPDLPPLAGPENYLPDSNGTFDGYLYPAQGTLTSGYGWRWGRMHRGIDVAAPVGTPIVAAAPGVVEFSGWNSGGYGNMVEVRHPDGSMTRYAHNSRNLVRVGQRVAQGEQIAAMGSTGYSTGPHVHFEIHLPNQGAVNPVAYFR